MGDHDVHPIGLGCGAFGFAGPTEDEASIRTIHTALDAGIRLFDTALAYTSLDEPARSERILARALATHPAGADAVVATKGGHWRSGPDTFPVDGRPETLRRHCEHSLSVLGVETIALYQLHWPDPHVPFSESVGALAGLQAAGKIQHIGVSNVSRELLQTARSEAVIAAVQNHFSPLDESDRPLLDHCAEQQIAYLAWSPLGGKASRDLASHRPDLVEQAATAGVSTHRMALAWLLEQSPVLIPLVGASRPETVRDSARAAQSSRRPL